MNYKNTHKGFTLIELLIVVMMIGILAALLIPAFSGRHHHVNITPIHQDHSHQMIHSYSSGGGSSGGSDMMWYYMMYANGNNCPCYYYSSPTPVSNFSNVDFKQVSAVPAEVQQANQGPVESVANEELPPAVEHDVAAQEAAYDEYLTEQASEHASEAAPAGEASESSSESSSDSGSSGGDSGGGDGGGD